MRYLIFILMLLPLPAFALSCVPHSVANAYIQAANAKEAYLPVHGTLDFDLNRLPQTDWENQQATPNKTLIPATFQGTALRARGKPVPVEINLTLEVRCAGPWCPSPKPGDTLGFLRETAEGYVLSTNACGGFLFGQPTKAQVATMQNCLAGRHCDGLVRR
ncbi:hypothetical protein [Tateyamaria sp.]|uniref:hypothetical protein n=1 Tax=Tateyamaria sp. TaxID=1929288 RepID=UPI00329F4F4F